MPEGAKHKARERWTRWSGTPALIANIATVAQRLVAAEIYSAAELRIKVDAPAWEGEYITADDFAGTLTADDLPDIESIDVRHSFKDETSP
jgi:hypothetical protein